MKVLSSRRLLLVCCLCTPSALPQQAASPSDPAAALAHAEKARQFTVAARYPQAIAEWRQALRIAPANPVFHNLYGLALQQSGQVAAAQSEFRHALRLNPAFADAQTNLAYSLWQSRNIHQSAVETDRALLLSPDDPSLHLLRGEMFAQAADHAAACRQFALAAPWPPDPATRWRIMESCLLAGDRAHYLLAAGGLPSDSQMQLNIGVWLLRNNRANDSIPFLSHAAGDKRLAPVAPLSLAEAFLAACRPEESLATLTTISTPPSSEFQVRDLRGSALLALGRNAEAETEFHRLVQQFPNRPEAYIAATQMGLQQKRWDDVLAILSDGLARIPGDWLLLFRRGMAYKLSGRVENARVDLLASLKADGDVSLVAAALGDLEAESGDLDSAADLFRATWIQTKLPQFRLAYAMALDRMGRSPDALKELREMARDLPKNAQLHYSLGKLLARQGFAREALAEFEKVRQSEPALAINLYALGHLYLVLGEPEKARAVMAEFQRAKRQPAPAPCRAP